MKRIYYLLTATSAIFCISCNKSTSEEDKKLQEQATAFQASIVNHTYRLTNFYSDKPIDYNPYDSVVKSETDLNIYVLPYLWDDQYTYSNAGKLDIAQGANKIGGESADVLHFDYQIGVKPGNVYFNYFDYYYKPMQYNLDSFNDSTFIIWVNGPIGSKLFSRFVRIK